MNNNHQYDQQLGLNLKQRSKPIKLVRNQLSNFKNHQLVQNHGHGQMDYFSISGIVPDQFDWFWTSVMGWDHVVGHTGNFFDFPKFWRSLTKFIDIVKKKSNLSKMKNNHQYDQQLGLNP